MSHPTCFSEEHSRKSEVDAPEDNLEVGAEKKNSIRGTGFPNDEAVIDIKYR